MLLDGETPPTAIVCGSNQLLVGCLSVLNERGIGNAVYYPAALHQLEPCSRYVRKGQTFPEAEKAAEEVLAIPMFPGMTWEQQKKVVDAIISSVTQIS